jgi:AraC-like DNA-binding protein/mannose-6-phosphate isomerase-like protein (cupin superfamily)
MKKYNFEQIELESQYPVNAFITSIDNSSFHWHHEYEIIIVLKGSVVIYTNPKPVKLEANDILLVNSKVVHSIKHTEEENICLFVQMHPSLFRNNQNDNANYYFYLNSVDEEIPAKVEYKHFIKLAAQIALLFLKKDIKSYYRIRSILYTIVADFFEYVAYDMHFRAVASNDNAFTMMQIIEYIQHNLRSENLLKTLYKDLGMSEKTVYRFLKENIGLSAKELIDNMRIDEAKNLLKYSSKHMNYIVDECGFTSENTFYRIFKSKVGMTPNEYRTKGISVEKNPQIKGYLNFTQKEALEILLNLEENIDEV